MLARKTVQNTRATRAFAGNPGASDRLQRAVRSSPGCDAFLLRSHPAASRPGAIPGPLFSSPLLASGHFAATLSRSLSGFGLGPRRDESRCQARRQRGGVAGPHNELATTHGAANRLGPSGWACKEAHAALQMLAGCAIRLRFAPCLHPLADPTRTQPKARQAPSATGERPNP